MVQGLGSNVDALGVWGSRPRVAYKYRKNRVTFIVLQGKHGKLTTPPPITSASVPFDPRCVGNSV